MIKSEREYKKAMRDMIRRVQSAKNADEINDATLTMEEAEILTDCILEGYVRGKVEEELSNGRVITLRTLDGKAHPEIYNTVIPLKGLAFLKPENTALKATIAICASVIASLVSISALFVSLLSSLDKILVNLEILRAIFH